MYLVNLYYQNIRIVKDVFLFLTQLCIKSNVKLLFLKSSVILKIFVPINMNKDKNVFVSLHSQFLKNVCCLMST